MKNIVVLALLAVYLSLPGCSGLNSLSSSSITTEQAQAGAAYLQSSIESLQKALDAAKPTGDANKIATAQTVLDQANVAAKAFQNSIASSASQSKWDVARSILSTAVEVLGPIAVQALVAK